MKRLILLSSILTAFACGDGSEPSEKSDAGTVKLTPDSPEKPKPVNWVQQFGDTEKSQSITDLVVDEDGNHFIAGDYEGDIDFGGGVLKSGGKNSVFLAKLSADGKHLWSHTYGNGERQRPSSLALTKDKGVVVVGNFEGEITFGDEDLKSAGYNDIFIAKFNTDGTHAWSYRFGDAARQAARAVKIDSKGDVLVVGQFAGAVDFGGGLLTSAGITDIFIAKFSVAGKHIWSKQFGGISAEVGTDLAIDADDNIVITGSISGTMSFGGDSLQSAGGTDVFLAKLKSDGTHVWSKNFGDKNTRQTGTSLAINSKQNIVLGATFRGSIDFGGGVLDGGDGIDSDIGIANFKADGSHVWSQSYGDDRPQSVASVAVDSSDNVHFAGQYRGAINFGGSALESDTYVGYAVTLDVGGKHVDTQTFASGDVKPQVVALDGWNQRVLAGRFWGEIERGGKTLSAEKGDYDAFIVVLPNSAP